MKILSKTTLVAAVSLAVCSLALTSAHAVAITLNVGLADSYAIGQVFGSASNGGQPVHDNADINQLIGMGASTSGNFAIAYGTYFYNRSTMNTSLLPTVSTTGENYNDAGAIGGLGTTTIGGLTYLQIALPVTGGYTYLLAKYDGQNGGGMLWDIASIAAGTTINIPLNAHPVGGTNLVAGESYGMTSFLLANPTTTNRTNVPDGGSTVFLLGAVSSGLGMMARRFKK